MCPCLCVSVHVCVFLISLSNDVLHLSNIGILTCGILSCSHPAERDTGEQDPQGPAGGAPMKHASSRDLPNSLTAR